MRGLGEDLAQQAKFCYDAAAFPSAPQGFARMTWRLVLAVLLAVLAARPAAAHAIIIDSSPAVNATVPGPDLDITLRFNSRIDRARSSVMLTAKSGMPRNLPLAALDRPDILKAHADSLAPGSYSLRWQVLSVDGHITRGDIPFTVGR
jgi:copper resistance protein C